ncbi:MAG: DUF6887 family protein [Microcystaceae cyanobacterium]
MRSHFEMMTVAELKSYALSHRHEIEPLRELYRRRTPDAEAVWFQAPQTIEEQERQMNLIQQVITNKRLTKNL